jgi:hypothetical protein
MDTPSHSFPFFIYLSSLGTFICAALTISCYGAVVSRYASLLLFHLVPFFLRPNFVSDRLGTAGVRVAMIFNTCCIYAFHGAKRAPSAMIIRADDEDFGFERAD